MPLQDIVCKGSKVGITRVMVARAKNKKYL